MTSRLPWVHECDYTFILICTSRLADDQWRVRLEGKVINVAVGTGKPHGCEDWSFFVLLIVNVHQDVNNDLSVALSWSSLIIFLRGRNGTQWSKVTPSLIYCQAFCVQVQIKLFIYLTAKDGTILSWDHFEGFVYPFTKTGLISRKVNTGLNLSKVLQNCHWQPSNDGISLLKLN